MKKALACIFGGVASAVGLFLGYATLCLNFSVGDDVLAQAGMSQAGISTMIAASRDSGNMTVSFSEFITKFDQKDIIWSYISVVLIYLAIICAAIVLVAGIISLINKGSKITETLKTKWLSILALVFMGLALIIGFVFPDYGIPNAGLKAMGIPAEFAATIALGSIIFLAGNAIAGALQFFIKDEN